MQPWRLGSKNATLESGGKLGGNAGVFFTSKLCTIRKCAFWWPHPILLVKTHSTIVTTDHAPLTPPLKHKAACICYQPLSFFFFLLSFSYSPLPSLPLQILHSCEGVTVTLLQRCNYFHTYSVAGILVLSGLLKKHSSWVSSQVQLQELKGKK